jgi:integrase
VGDRRAEFSHAELEQIMAYFPTFIANSRAGRTQTIREVLALYVPFMAATGMRPGTEAEFLEWRHIDVEVRDGTPVLHFRIQRGKRGARNFVAHNSCWLILERLRQMVPDFAQMTLQQVLKKRVPRRLFCLPDGSMPESFNKPFKALLEEAKLLHCLVTGKERSLYSLRHYYATQRLLESVPISDLADQMGTSILMITKHYSHLTPLMKAKQFVGTVQDGHLGIDGATIRSLMAAQLANQNVMSLVHAGTGLTLPVREQSPALASDLEARLDARLKAST